MAETTDTVAEVTPPGGPWSRHDLGDQLIRTFKLIQQLRAHMPRVHPDVDPLAYPLLARLAEQPRRLSDLAEAVHLDISTVSRQVSNLVDLGMATRAPDPDDGRATQISLSADGASLFAELRERRAVWLGKVHRDWSAAEVADFTDHLARFADDIERYRSELRRPASSTITQES